MSGITDKLTSTHSELLKLSLMSYSFSFYCFILEDFPFHVDHGRAILLVLKFEFNRARYVQVYVEILRYCFRMTICIHLHGTYN